MAKIMRTIKDVESDIRRETTSTKPLLADDYTYGNLGKIREKLSNKTSPDNLSGPSLETEAEENDII